MSELTPYLCVTDTRAAIAWYTETLGAKVTYDPIEMPDGRIGHVEMSIDGARWMMADEFPEVGVAAPAKDVGAAVTLHLSVDDVDALVERVIAAGVPMDRGPEDDSVAGRIACLPRSVRTSMVSQHAALTGYGRFVSMANEVRSLRAVPIGPGSG